MFPVGIAYGTKPDIRFKISAYSKPDIFFVDIPALPHTDVPKLLHRALLVIVCLEYDVTVSNPYPFLNCARILILLTLYSKFRHSDAMTEKKSYGESIQFNTSAFMLFFRSLLAARSSEVHQRAWAHGSHLYKYSRNNIYNVLSVVL